MTSQFVKGPSFSSWS